MRLFLLALQPYLPADRLAADHARADRGLERDGPPVLREHLRDRGSDAGMSPLDPRLEQHRPALVYDPQEAYRAMSAASITDYRNNVLKRGNGDVVSRAGDGLSLQTLTTYTGPKDGDRLDEDGDPLPASRHFQADPNYRERVYGRVKEDGGRTWLQYWLWCYYNPKHLLGLGKHEGDWEMVQVGLGANGTPEAVTYSQHEGGEGHKWEDVKHFQNDHPIAYVAPLSHACYFEAGRPSVRARRRQPGRLAAADPPARRGVRRLEDLESAAGATRPALRRQVRRPQPGEPGNQGQKWDNPNAWHTRGLAKKPLRIGSQAVRQAGRATYPKLREHRRRA